MPARLSQELVIFEQLEAQDKICLAQEAAEMVEKHQQGSKRAAVAPALGNKAKKAKKDMRDESEEEEESFPGLSAKELEQRRTTSHDIVKDAMWTEGVVEKWHQQHKKPCFNCGETRECKHAPKEICCKTCVERKMQCPYIVDFLLEVLKANGRFSSDLSCYIATHIKTVTVKVARNKGMLPSATGALNEVLELSEEELDEEDNLEDDDGEAKGKKGDEGSRVKGKGSNPGKRKIAKSAGSSKPPHNPLKILLRPWQVQAALPCTTTSVSSCHLRSSTSVKQDQGVVRHPCPPTPPFYYTKVLLSPPVVSPSHFQLPDSTTCPSPSVPLRFGSPTLLIPLDTPMPVSDPLPSYKQLEARTRDQEQELSFDTQKKALDDAVREVARCRKEIDRLESGGSLSVREEEGLLRHAALDTIKAELQEVRRELGNLVAKVSCLERIVQMRDQELWDFANFEEFQDEFADCVQEHFVSNCEVMGMVEVEYQAVREHLVTLGRLVGNNTGALAGSLKLVMRHLEGIRGGLERALAHNSQTHETHLLPMGAGGAPSLEDCLRANLSPVQEIGHMWGWKHEAWLRTKDSHMLARILEERRNDDDEIV